MDIREIFGEQGDSKICSQKERVVGPLQQIDQRIPVFCTCTGGLIGRNDSLSKIHDECDALFLVNPGTEILLDRKSTRLNSSHVAISYAVFCLKKIINSYKLIPGSILYNK